MNELPLFRIISNVEEHTVYSKSFREYIKKTSKKILLKIWFVVKDMGSPRGDRWGESNGSI